MAGEEGVPLVGPGPLRRRIGWRDELWRNRAGRAEGGIVERRQVLANRPAGVGIVGSPFTARHGTLLVGVGGDQAGVDGEAFASYEAFGKAALDHRLEQVPQDVALPKATMPVA